jgi:hypothetical protein
LPKGLGDKVRSFTLMNAHLFVFEKLHGEMMRNYTIFNLFLGNKIGMMKAINKFKVKVRK